MLNPTTPLPYYLNINHKLISYPETPPPLLLAFKNALLLSMESGKMVLMNIFAGQE